MRKLMAVDAFVRWAVVEEWPKAAVDRRAWSSQAKATARRDLGFGGDVWAMMGEFDTLGTVVDVNRYGMVPGDAGEMHGDAEVLFRVLVDLDAAADALVFVLPPLDDIAADWSAEVRDLARPSYQRAAERVGGWTDVAGEWSIRGSSLERVRIRSVLGAPVDAADVPTVDLVRRNGSPAWFRKQRFVIDGEEIVSEVDGFNRSARRPHGDAYQKRILEPDPAHILEARLEHQLWHGLLTAIVLPLNRRLRDHEVCTPSFSSAPWLREPLTATVS